MGLRTAIHGSAPLRLMSSHRRPLRELYSAVLPLDRGVTRGEHFHLPHMSVSSILMVLQNCDLNQVAAHVVLQHMDNRVRPDREGGWHKGSRRRAGHDLWCAAHVRVLCGGDAAALWAADAQTHGIEAGPVHRT